MKQRTADPFPAWADAQLGIKYIDKGKARGSRFTLLLRKHSQKRLGELGKWAGRRGGLVIFVGIVSLALLCIGIQSIKLDTTLDTLWTPDSGRLSTEVNFVSKSSGLTTDTNEMLIQTPKSGSHHSILNSKALLEHLGVLEKALSVTVDLFDVQWTMKDLCYSANTPSVDVQFVDQIFEKVFPCVIVTPLDCFWEGSKLLGPNVSIQIPGFGGNLRWTSLNPQELLMKAKLGGQTGEVLEVLEKFMKRGGIGSGYQEKPCLNPKDPDCPITAPNKGSEIPPDVASILSRGCYGFAPRFMHWAPDLIIGGPEHNKSGHVVRAGGLMSTVQLMSSSELYEFFKETWRLNHVEWTESKAQAVLAAWQAKFAERVKHLTMDEESNHFNFYTFTPSGLDSVVESASQFTWTSAGIRIAGVIFLTIVVGLIFDGGNGSVSRKARVGLIVAGTVVALLGTAAGCGVAALLKISFNVASVQVLPYLAMSLISQVLFILLHSQLNGTADAKTTLRKHGFSIVLGIALASCLIALGGLFPIPAVRNLAFQGGIFLAVGSIALMVVYPAVCQLVLKKRKPPGHLNVQNVNVNVINTDNKNATGSLKPLSSFKNNNISWDNEKNGQDKSNCNLLNNERTDKTIRPEDIDLEIANDAEDGATTCSGNSWPSIYLSIMSWKWFNGIIVMLYLACIVFAVFGVTKLRLGLPITDVVPSHSSEWEFLTAQGKLFPVYHMRAVTKSNFDYPNNQKLLNKFHETMSGLPWIIRDDNGGVPPMWLTVFKTWLQKLQDVFDHEWKLGYLNKEGWKTGLASSDGILAWKLAVQTGHAHNPVDKTQVPSNRLVDSEGIINSQAFYVYLTAWAWNDPLAYGMTASNLKPEPRLWLHTAEDPVLTIPKSAPIKYAEISYLLRTSKEDGSIEEDQESQILAFVKEIRGICEKFEARGLPVFPWGIPFRFYDQYLTLPLNSLQVIGLSVAFFVAVLFMALGFSWRPVCVVVVAAAITSLQIAGAIGWLGVGLNALPVEIALLGVSLVIFPTVQIVVAFCCIPGSVSDRRSVSFNLVGPPCVQSLILVSLTALILYSPEFTFIFTHFTLLVALSSIFSLINVLLLVPVLLALLKPSAWLVGNMPEDPAYLQPLTPSPIPRRGGSSRSGGRSGSSNRTGGKSRGNYPPAPYNFRGSNSRNSHHGSSRTAHNRAPSEHSLSTITEEPTSCATRRSAEIVVQPHVVVEHFDRDSNSTTTKVSAKLKVEVHSSVHSSNSNNNPQSSVNTSTNMSENSGTSTSTSSSGSFTSSSASSTSSYNERMSMDE